MDASNGFFGYSNGTMPLNQGSGQQNQHIDNQCVNIPVMGDNHRLFENPSNNNFHMYNNEGNTDGYNEADFTFHEYGNEPVFQNNQTNPYPMVNQQYYEFPRHQYQESSPFFTHYNNLNQQFQGISLQDNRNPSFNNNETQLFSNVQQSSPPAFAYTFGMLPSLPSEVTSNNENETSESSEDSEGSSNLPSPSPKNVKRGRGRPKFYKTEVERKRAKTGSQKRYMDNKKAAVKKLKTEVLALEKQNIELAKHLQARLKLCKKMLLHKDLPELEQRVVGAIIGFE